MQFLSKYGEAPFHSFVPTKARQKDLHKSGMLILQKTSNWKSRANICIHAQAEKQRHTVCPGIPEQLLELSSAFSWSRHRIPVNVRDRLDRSNNFMRRGLICTQIYVKAQNISIELFAIKCFPDSI